MRTRRVAPNLFVIARLFSELNKMKRITFFMLTLLALIAASSTARAQTKLGPKDSQALPAADLNRIKAGDAAPDFTLEDQDGKPVTLSDYRGKKTVVLVFYRGHWWIHCSAQLGTLKSLLNEQLRDRAEVLAVSIDPHDKAVFLRNKLKDQPGFDFPLLSDIDHRVIDRYGLLNEQSKRGWPHPATYVIDGKGVVRWKFVEVDYKKRPSNEDVLAEVMKADADVK
jgi:mycoredoxin-dependent peroxiredoxin